MNDITAEKTNPVMDTARLTLSQLAAAGIREAADCADKLGLARAMESYNVTEEKITPFAVMQEARFHFMNYYFREAGCRTVVDVACGFSPRGLLMAREGYRYLGLDLQAAAAAMTGVAEEICTEERLPGSFCYEMVDITDPAALTGALEKVDGPVAMGCEGLLVYLGRYEFESMLQGISGVLHDHGGCFITPDLVSAQFMFGIFTAILGDEKGKAALLELSSRIQEKSDTTFRGTLSRVPMEEWEKVFAGYGLQCELIPFLPEDAQLRSFDRLSPETVCAIRRRISQVRCLKLTPLPGSEKKVFKSVGATAEITRAGETLMISLTGRLDSVTAPMLLEQYEKAKLDGAVRAITIDAAQLEYISSAGLRTMLIMQKDLTENRVLMRRVSGPVMDILEQTGFNSVLNVSQ